MTREIYINIGAGVPANTFKQWNSASDDDTVGVKVADCLDKNGNLTSIGFEVTQDNWGAPQINGMNAVGIGAAAWVDEALISDSNWSLNSGNHSVIKFTGLRKNKKYNILIFGSRDNGTEGQYVLTILSGYDVLPGLLDVGLNSSRIYTANEIDPNVGEIFIGMQLGGSNGLGHFNAIALIELDDPDPSPFGPAVIRKPTRPSVRPILNKSHWLAKELSHWYPSPETNSIWRDRSGFNRGLITLDSGTSPLIATSQGNNAIDFNTGNSEFTTTDVGILPGIEKFTIGFWAKGGTYIGTNFGVTIYQAVGSSSELVGVYPYDDVGGQGARFFHTGANAVDQNTGAVGLGEWHFFVATHRSNTDQELYVNGVSVGAGNRGLPMPATVNRIGIGHWDGGQNATNCEIKDVTIHTRGMSSGEVARWYRPQHRWGLYDSFIHLGEPEKRDLVVF